MTAPSIIRQTWVRTICTGKMKINMKHLCGYKMETPLLTAKDVSGYLWYEKKVALLCYKATNVRKVEQVSLPMDLHHVTY
jgi:hypothetical protein